MIIDSSAIIAILRSETEAVQFAQAIAASPTRRLSVANYVEAAMVIDSASDPILSRKLNELLTDAGIVLEPVTPAQAEIARGAFKDFGRNSGSPARLNFGDCFAYALARDYREPLLFKGRGFTHTDIRPAI